MDTFLLLALKLQLSLRQKQYSVLWIHPYCWFSNFNCHYVINSTRYYGYILIVGSQTSTVTTSLTVLGTMDTFLLLALKLQLSLRHKQYSVLWIHSYCWFSNFNCHYVKNSTRYYGYILIVGSQTSTVTMSKTVLDTMDTLFLLALKLQLSLRQKQYSVLWIHSYCWFSNFNCHYVKNSTRYYAYILIVGSQTSTVTTS